MNRYFLSFLIAAIIYILLIIGYLYSLENQKVIKPTVNKSNETVKFTVIAAPKPIEKPKPKKIEKPKPKPKKIEKPKPKPKPIEKPKPKKIEKPKPKPKPIEKPKPKKIVQKELKTQIKKNKSVLNKEIDTEALKKEALLRNEYFNKIRSTINENKSYPKRAIRRKIQGDVKVKFTISAKGDLLSYEIIDGKKIFKQSVIKAIKNSFPIEIPNGIFSKDLDLSLVIKYNLY